MWPESRKTPTMEPVFALEARKKTQAMEMRPRALRIDFNKIIDLIESKNDFCFP